MNGMPMKKILSIIISVILLAAVCIADSTAAEPSDIVKDFFSASANGDVMTMSELSAGAFYERRKTLLEMNQGYPEFLKKYYSGVIVKIGKVYSSNDEGFLKNNHKDLYERHSSTPHFLLKRGRDRDYYKYAIVIVKLQFPDGSKFNTKLLLKKGRIDGWKIYDEIMTTEPHVSADD
jgi:hypothetical protein